jgi:hypothetical protein
MERDEDDDLLFLKSLLPDIKSLPRCGNVAWVLNSRSS